MQSTGMTAAAGVTVYCLFYYVMYWSAGHFFMLLALKLQVIPSLTLQT